MERKITLRAIFILILVIIAGVASVTTVEKLTGKTEQSILPTFLKGMFPGINPGLDLQGGLRLIYEVEVEIAVEDRRDRIAESLIETLKEKSEMTNVKMKRGVEPHLFDLVFGSANDRQSSEVRNVLKDFRQSAVVQTEEDNISHMALVENLIEYTKDIAVKQAQEKIGNRTDALGLENTGVSASGSDIIVEIPGVDEARVARIKRIISTTAHLEFKIVDYEGSGDFFLGIKDKLSTDGPIKLKTQQVEDGKEGSVFADYFLEANDQPGGKSGLYILKEFLKTVEIPENRSIGFNKSTVLDKTGLPTADVSWRTYYMERLAGITGDYIDNAAVTNDPQTNKPNVSLTFNQVGASKFADLTEKNVKRHMAIVLDDNVQSAPVINERIGGGRAQITLGSYRPYNELYEEAKELEVVLKAGSLPAPIKPVTETTVGPLLGRDSIAMGKIAFIVATIAILIFMVLYYKGGGVAADIALLINAGFIIGIMSMVGATLTLPGIAGIILTLGMAVDANVIIYERIREELRAGKSPRAAVEVGYKRAFMTILDSQVTTAIAGIVLFQYGEKDIKGFALTLLIGIATSMFTAIYISRICFDWMTRKRADTLSI